jgi:hypothetical protein
MPRLLRLLEIFGLHPYGYGRNAGKHGVGITVNYTAMIGY